MATLKNLVYVYLEAYTIPNNESNFPVKTDSWKAVLFLFTVPVHSPLQCLGDGLQAAPAVDVAVDVVAAVGVAAAGTPAACTAGSAGPAAVGSELPAVEHQ